LFSQNCLKFPSDEDVSPEGTDLMRKLLTGAGNRLSYEQICVHPFFRSIDMDNIRHSE
jgi:hypothetical protein